MQRRSYTSDEGWLLSYADLITNLLIFNLSLADLINTIFKNLTIDYTDESLTFYNLAVIKTKFDHPNTNNILAD